MTTTPRKRPLSSTAYVQRTKPRQSEPRYRAYVVTYLGTYDTRAEADEVARKVKEQRAQ